MMSLKRIWQLMLRTMTMHGKPPAAENANTVKPDSAAAKQKVKIVEPKKAARKWGRRYSSDDGFDTNSSEDEFESDENVLRDTTKSTSGKDKSTCTQVPKRMVIILLTSVALAAASGIEVAEEESEISGSIDTGKKKIVF